MRLGKPRAALIVYRMVRGEPHFLLVSASKQPNKLTLPGGKIDPDESPTTAAARETREEAGVLTRKPAELGRYLHRKRGRRYYPTQTYLARYARSLKQYEPRTRLWLSLEELQDPKHMVRKPILKQLKRAAATIKRRRVAA